MLGLPYLFRKYREACSVKRGNRSGVKDKLVLTLENMIELRRKFDTYQQVQQAYGGTRNTSRELCGDVVQDHKVSGYSPGT